ncbi:zf-CCHC domain-containing protein [Tanacetum coccineum]
MRQPRNDKKMNDKSDRKCFRCGDPNHLIGECPKPPKDKNPRAFVGGSWSDSGEEDDEKAKDETCLVAQASNEVCFDSSYFSDENSSIDDLTLANEYDKLCKMSLKIITKNKRLKAIRNSLENELSELKLKFSTLEKNKGVDLECTNCQSFKIENEKLKEEALKLTKYEKSTHFLNEMLSNQKPSGDKLGLGFNSCEASTSLESKVMDENVVLLLGEIAWLMRIFIEVIRSVTRFSFFLQMGFTIILATFDGLDVGLLEDVIGEDDCDDDDCDEEMSLVRMLVDGC